jgi:dTMP kinase
MDELEILLQTLRSVVEDTRLELEDEFPPVFSFEGLPGAGKTTQIEKVAKDLVGCFGRAHYIDLPTESVFGQMLRAIYASKSTWLKIRSQAPWMNPLLLSVDMRLALEEARRSSVNYILMSRGVLSTYYYNIGAFLERTGDLVSSWQEMTRILNGFAMPRAILLFDLPVEEAHRRVVARNRGALREMDQISNMVEDRMKFDRYLELFKGQIPVHYVNAAVDEDSVTVQVKKILEMYLNMS